MSQNIISSSWWGCWHTVQVLHSIHCQLYVWMTHTSSPLMSKQDGWPKVYRHGFTCTEANAGVHTHFKIKLLPNPKAVFYFIKAKLNLFSKDRETMFIKMLVKVYWTIVLSCRLIHDDCFHSKLGSFIHKCNIVDKDASKMSHLPLLSHWEQWIRASGLPLLLASLPFWQMPHIAFGMTLGCKGKIML